jgi:ubiquinone/menaquinone biosynthesis C-methylase UbiE
MRVSNEPQVGSLRRGTAWRLRDRTDSIYVSQTISEFYQRFQTDSVDADRLGKVLEEAVAVAPKVVLDIGCGRGAMLERLRERSPQTVLLGIELSDASAAEARRRGIAVFQQSVEDGLPLEDASVDLVVFGEVIEHLYDPDACLDEIHRVLVPGGTLIVTTPNLASWFNRLLLLFGVQPLYTETSTRKKYGRVLTALGNGSTDLQGHLRIYTRRALVDFISDVGFQIVRVRGACFGGFDAVKPVAYVDRVLSSVPEFASLLVVHAKKTERRA